MIDICLSTSGPSSSTCGYGDGATGYISVRYKVGLDFFVDQHPVKHRHLVQLILVISESALSLIFDEAGQELDVHGRTLLSPYMVSRQLNNGSRTKTPADHQNPRVITCEVSKILCSLFFKCRVAI